LNKNREFVNLMEIGGKFRNFVEIRGEYAIYIIGLRGMDAPVYGKIRKMGRSYCSCMYS